MVTAASLDIRPGTTDRTIPVGRRGPRKRVGVIELIAYTVSSEWLSLAPVNRFKRQFYSVMPQVVAVWCRELGHDVTYATYYGQADPLSLLPDDLDVVFVSASTQASALAYALAKLYRRRGTLTVIGGPHAKCFPADCARFFDVTVKRCDRALVADIVAGRVDRGGFVDCGRALRSFPSVEERLPEIATAAFPDGRAGSTSVISLFGSVGCPYTCNFCTDWNSTYVARPADELGRDLDFVSRRFPDACLGFQDPNFGVRFDETLAAFESIPDHRRNPYLMQCSLAVLSEARLKRLAETRCLYIAPGIESWSDYGNKLKMKQAFGRDRVAGVADAFTRLRAFVPGLQANFVLGLDSDAGSAPFDLTKEFAGRVPFVWPNVNIITPYGGTPVYDAMVREGRLLRAMPLALYCSPYLALRLRNYDAIEFYDNFIDLLEASISPMLTTKRLLARGRVTLKIARMAQTSAVRHDVREMRRIRAELGRDTALRAFHDGRDVGLPPFYSRHLDQRLGRYAELLTSDDRVPLHALPSRESPVLERPAA
ncbi:MAG: radical SAM protein [Alphaproteobacteria bacterium]